MQHAINYTVHNCNKQRPAPSYFSNRLARQNFPLPMPASAAACNSQDYEAFGYDPNGNRTSLQRRDGQSLSFTYDALDRETQKVVPNAPSTTNGYAVYTSYDLAGRVLSATFTSTSGLGVYYGYDAAGRMTSEATFGKALTYTYDAASNLASMAWPDGVIQANTMDGANRLTATGISGQAAVSLSFGYDAVGRMAALTRGNGANSTLAYDTADRLTSLAHVFTNPVANVAYGVSFTPAGQISTRTLSNLTYRWPSTQVQVQAKAYDGLNRDATIVAASGYDLTGNVRADGVHALVYDEENKLRSASAPASATFTYDPLGRLATMAISGGATTQFLYSGPDLVAEYDGSSNLLRRYVDGPGVDDPEIWLEGSGVTSASARFLHKDRQGSVVGWSDATGTQQATYTYGPWGEPNTWAGSRFRYTGQIALPELSLYHYKARIYDPVAGRFMQTDPVGYKSDMNLYGYVHDDPLNLTDPTGETCVIANGWSSYCMRAHEYAGFDSMVGSKTRFFGAASMTTRMLADLDMPIGNNVISTTTRSFMGGLSRDLQGMNEREALAIEHGRLGGSNLDARMVHAEQTSVQGHLDSLARSDPSGYGKVISEVNGLLNGKNAASMAGSLYGDDRHYQSVLNGVRTSLGRDIDFAKQGDREAIGNALIKDLRNSGACATTGSRIPTC